MEKIEIKNNIVKTVVPGLSVPQVDLVDYLEPLLEKHGGKIALIDGISRKSLTYQDLLSLSSKLAGALQRHGAKKGDFITVHSRSRMDFWILFIAVIRIGGVVVLARPSLNSRELLVQLEDSKTSFLVFEDVFHEKVLEIKDKVPFIKEIFVSGKSFGGFTSIESLLEDGDGSRFESQWCDSPSETPVMITCSSGTTGIPKGVMHSHKSLLAMMTGFGPEGRTLVSESEIILTSVPTTHFSGIVIGLNSLNSGATNVLLPDFEIKTVLEAIHRFKVNKFPCFPTKLQQLLNSPLLPDYDISSVNSFITGGSACPDAMFDAAIKLFSLKEVLNTYGLSEGMLSCTDQHRMDYQHVGKPLPLTEIKIADVDTGKTLPLGERGEVRARGPQILLGYFNLPEVTASLFDEEGFLKTGDIGYCDDKGNLYITDRLKDMVKCMDQQVGPTEVEYVLVQHSAVKEAAVVGIPHESFGETLRAFVILKQGKERRTSSQELIDFVAEHFPFFKRLHGGLEFVDHLPTNETGKYLRREIRQNYLQSLSE